MSNISTRSIMLFALLFLFSQALSAQFFTEDFDGAIPASWTTTQADASPVNATSNWVHSTTGPAGGFQINPVASATAANGFALFDSDLNCSGGQDVWLISPSVDCSSYSEVFLQYQTYYRAFNSKAFLEISVDGMNNWTTIDIFKDANGDPINNNDFSGAADGSENPVIMNTDLTALIAGQADVNIAFRFVAVDSTVQAGTDVGCGYSWMVDDVALTDEDPTPLYDMQANAGFYAIPPSVITPASQVEPIAFLCDIENTGQLANTNVNLNITIEDNAGMVVHTQDLPYGTYQPGFVNLNAFFPNQYTPPSTPVAGPYVGTYTVSMDSMDLNPGNNSQTFGFLVSDSTFAKEGGAGLFNATTPAAETSAASTWATSYYIPNETAPNGNKYVCSSIQFAIGNAAEIAGTTVNATLYEWEDVSDDDIAQAVERNGTAGGRIVGNASYEIQGGDEVITIALENWDDDEEPVWLSGQTTYIIAIAYTPNGTTKPTIQGTDAFDYGAMSFVTDTLMMQRHSTFWNINDTSFDADLTPLAFAPRIRMHVNEEIPTSVEDRLSNDNRIDVYPNPAVDMVTLDLDLVESFTNANVRITDATGKVVMERNYENIQSEKFHYNVSQFAAGTYFLHFTSEEGSRAVRFIVSK